MRVFYSLNWLYSSRGPLCGYRRGGLGNRRRGSDKAAAGIVDHAYPILLFFPLLGVRAHQSSVWRLPMERGANVFLGRAGNNGRAVARMRVVPLCESGLRGMEMDGYKSVRGTGEGKS